MSQPSTTPTTTLAQQTPRVLVVEDDPDVAAALGDLLRREGFAADTISDGTGVVNLVTTARPDLVLLDLGLPSVDGLDLLEEIAPLAPVIVVSGRAGEGDRVLGLDLGADDYVAKPFSGRELMARVRSVLRRAAADRGRCIVHGALEIDLGVQEARIAGNVIGLTHREFELLAYLAARPRLAFGRAQLLRDVWASAEGWQDSATVTEHVRRVRLKLGPLGSWVQTVRSVGYRFDPSVDARARRAASSTSTDDVGSATDSSVPLVSTA